MPTKEQEDAYFRRGIDNSSADMPRSLRYKYAMGFALGIRLAFDNPDVARRYLEACEALVPGTPPEQLEVWFREANQDYVDWHTNMDRNMKKMGY